MLRQMVTASQAHLDLMDAGGTKGVAVVQAQLVEVVRDLTELKAEVDKRFDVHMQMHNQDQRDRAAARRWAVGTFVAALAIVVTLLLNITLHLR